MRDGRFFGRASPAAAASPGNQPPPTSTTRRGKPEKGEEVREGEREPTAEREQEGVERSRRSEGRDSVWPTGEASPGAEPAAARAHRVPPTNRRQQTAACPPLAAHRHPPTAVP